MKSYTYIDGKVIHSLDLKISQNSKIGIGVVLQTYHFSLDQVQNNDFTLDAANCLDCPFSYNQNDGKSGGCYTHKGLQLMGLKSKLRSLNKKLSKGLLSEFNPGEFKSFIEFAKNKVSPKLIRCGAYGEAVTLETPIRDALFKLAADTKSKVTGYTHQWHKVSETRFMASAHTLADMVEARARGYRSFIVSDDEISEGFNCPASAESGKKKTCLECGLCSGTFGGKKKKDIYILQH
jgi:hypothetical protein